MYRGDQINRPRGFQFPKHRFQIPNKQIWSQTHKNKVFMGPNHFYKDDNIPKQNKETQKTKTTKKGLN